MAEVTDTSLSLLLDTSVVAKDGKVGGFIIGKSLCGEQLGGV